METSILKTRFPSLVGKPSRGPEIPKVSPVRNRAAREKCRAKGRRENPSCKLKASTKWNPIDVHHKKTRGSGGGDTAENLMALCRTCHDLIHVNPEFKRAMAVVAEGRK